MSKVGIVFSIPSENPPAPGCTVSQRETDLIYHFSLAPDTNISPESYPTHKLWLVHAGEMIMQPNGTPLHSGESFLTPIDTPIGCSTTQGCIYTEIILRSDTKMNKILESGKVFALKDLLPYQEGRIVNMDLINEPKLKFVLMSFDADTGLSEHAAPGEALVFALDGEGVIGYEGTDYAIHAGETFKFAKNGLHSVKASVRFKMALLLTLE